MVKAITFFCLFILTVFVLAAGTVQAIVLPSVYDDTHNSLQVSLSPDGQYICACGLDTQSISLFDRNGTPLWHYRINENATGCTVSENAAQTVFLTSDGRVLFFTSQGALFKKSAVAGMGKNLQFSDDGSSGYIFNGISGSDLAAATVSHVNAARTVDWGLHIPALSCAALTPDGRIAVIGTQIGGNSEVIRLLSNGTVAWRYPVSWWVIDVSVSEDGTCVAAEQKNRVLIFNETGQLLSNISLDYHGSSAGMSPDGSVIFAGMQYQVLAFNQTGDRLWIYPTDDYVEHIAVSGNSKDIAITSGKTLLLIDKTGRQIWNYSARDPAGSIAISRDSQIIAAGSGADTLHIINSTGSGIQIALGDISSAPLPEESSGSPSDIGIRSTTQTPKPAPVPVALTLISTGIAAVFICIQGRNKQ